MGLAAALNAVLIHPEGKVGHCFRYTPDVSVDHGELDHDPRVDGLARVTGAGVEGLGCADEDFGLVAGAE